MGTAIYQTADKTVPATSSKVLDLHGWFAFGEAVTMVAEFEAESSDEAREKFDAWDEAQPRPEERCSGMRCFACGGPYHPSTGHIFGDDVVYCGACYKPFVVFMKSRFYHRDGGPDFIAEALTSVRPPPTATSHYPSPWLNGSEHGPPKPEISGSTPDGDTTFLTP